MGAWAFFYNRVSTIFSIQFVMLYRMLYFCGNLLLMLIFVCVTLLLLCRDLFTIWSNSPVLSHDRDSLSKERPTLSNRLWYPQEITLENLCHGRLYSVAKKCVAGPLNSRLHGLMTSFWQLQALLSHINKPANVNSDM